MYLFNRKIERNELHYSHRTLLYKHFKYRQSEAHFSVKVTMFYYKVGIYLNANINY